MDLRTTAPNAPFSASSYAGFLAGNSEVDYTKDDALCYALKLRDVRLRVAEARAAFSAVFAGRYVDVIDRAGVEAVRNARLTLRSRDEADRFEAALIGACAAFKADFAAFEHHLLPAE